MKKILLTILLACSIAAVYAQETDTSEDMPGVHAPQEINARGRKFYPVNKHNKSIELNVTLFPLVNFVYEYNCTSWLSVGAGAGLMIPVVPVFALDVFGRVGFTAFAKRKVSPFFKVDGGLFFGYSDDFLLHGILTPMFGLEVKLKQKNKISFGLGSHIMILFERGTFPIMPVPNLRFGYTF